MNIEHSKALTHRQRRAMIEAYEEATNERLSDADAFDHALVESMFHAAIAASSIEDAPAASEGEDGAVAWQYQQHGQWVTVASDEPWRSKGLPVRPLFSDRPAAQVAATPKHDEGREAMAGWYVWLRDHASRDQVEAFMARRGTRLAADRLCATNADPALATQPAARRVTELEVSAAADRLVLKWNLHGPDAYRMANDALNAAAESFAQHSNAVAPTSQDVAAEGVSE